MRRVPKTWACSIPGAEPTPISQASLILVGQTVGPRGPWRTVLVPRCDFLLGEVAIGPGAAGAGCLAGGRGLLRLPRMP